MRLLLLNKVYGKNGKRPRGRSSTYADISDGLFPRPIKLGSTSAIPEHEVERVMAAEIAGWSKEERRELVRRIHAERTQAIEGVA